MILTRVQEFIGHLLQDSMPKLSSRCSGVVRMFMQEEVVREDISLNALTDGIISAQNKKVKNNSAMSVNSISGLGSHRKLLCST